MIKGLATTLKALERYPVKVQDDIKDAVEETTTNIYQNARMLAPSAGDPLRTSYGQQVNNTNISGAVFMDFKNKGFTGEIGISDIYGDLPIFVEFGTGKSAAGYVPTLPSDIQAIARRYYVNGLGKLLNAPFLWPSYTKYAYKLKGEIKLILQKNAR